MSISKSRVREEFESDSLFSFDPSVGYVRITEERVSELMARYDELVASGEMTASERDDLARSIAEKNKRNADADRIIKEKGLGVFHFYGEVGTPLLLEDRYRFGLS